MSSLLLWKSIGLSLAALALVSLAYAGYCIYKIMKDIGSKL